VETKGEKENWDWEVHLDRRKTGTSARLEVKTDLGETAAYAMWLRRSSVPEKNNEQEKNW